MASGLLAGSLLTCGDDAPTGETADGHPPLKRTTNEVAVVLRTEPDGLNPVLTTQGIARFVNEQIFQTLTEKDPETFEQVPHLAGLPDISPEPGGGTSYAYELDARATWPNGLPVTAQDVIFSLKAMLNPLVEAGPYRPYYSMISNVVTNPGNERRFKVMTDKPYVLAEEAIGSLWIYPEYVYDPDMRLRNVAISDLTNPQRAERLAGTNEDLRAFAEAFNDPDWRRNPERIVGSGPYRLVSWEDGQQIRLERRADYWAAGTDDPKLSADPEAIVFKVITDNNTVGNALRDELVDVVIALEIDQFQDFQRDEYISARYDFATAPSFKYFGILLNQRDPLMADVAVRRALAHCVDTEQIIEQLFPGLASRVVGPILPAKPYFNDELQPLAYDPAKAAQLLADAGWSDSNGDGTVDKEIDGQRRELRFELLSFTSPLSEAVTVITAEGARAAGMDIQVVKQEGRAVYGALNKGEYTASIYGLGFNPGPDDLTQNWASDATYPNGTNRGNFSDPEADRLIRQIRTTVDADERAPLYRRFQEIVYENQPMVFLFSPLDRIVVSKRFDYTTSSITPNVVLNAMEQQEWNRAKK